MTETYVFAYTKIGIIRLMNKIEVTPEIHKRIMENIENTDFETDFKTKSLFQEYKKYLAIAACLVICIVGAISLPDTSQFDQDSLVQVVPDMTHYTSKNELSAAIGFEVKDITSMPFDINEIQYIAYNKELAEIVYNGNSNVLVFRISKGNADISGDYNTYEDVKVCTINNHHITLKGNNGLYSLATWHDDKFAYSLQLDAPVSELDLSNIIQSIK